MLEFCLLNPSHHAASGKWKTFGKAALGFIRQG
jgi:hypothetical protein